MPRKSDAWGIEVGANALEAIRLLREGDEVRVVDYDVLPFKKVLTTPDINADDAIQVQLDQFLSRHEIAKSSIVVSVPGHMAFARFAKLPPVEPKKIPDIVKFEAVQQIPFPINQVTWDYQVFQEDDSPDVEVGIFAITRERVLEFLNNYRQVGLEIHGLTLSPLAAYNGMAYDMDLDGSSPGVILMDIGTQSTDVIIVERGRIWLRTLAIGGNTFTEALVKSFKLSFPKAEKLKREAGTSKYARQIFQAMRPVFADLVQEMQRSLGFYQSLNRDADLSKLVGLGSTFKLPGLIKFLKQQLQIDVSRPDGFEKITVEGKQEADFAEHAVNLATAYGCALQGVGLERVSASILPVQLTKARIWRAKQPWFGAAAAVMMAATGAAGYRLWNDKGAYAETRESSKAKIDKVLDAGKSLKARWDNVSRVDPRQRIENLRRILDYRDVWPKIMSDLALACKAVEPQPVLGTTDYGEIVKIPRERRSHVVIDSIIAEYRIREDEEAEPAKKTGSRTSTSYDELWGELNAGGGEASGGDPAALPGLPTLPSMRKKVEVKSQKGPEFLITLEGSTPFANGPEQLELKLIGWLKEHHKQLGRPYRIVATRESLESIAQDLGGGDKEKKDRATRRDFDQPQRGRAGQPSIVPRIVPGGGGPGAGTVDDRAKDGDSVIKTDDLIPTRPLADEDTSRDWKFTIKFAIQVLRPEEAREAQIGDDVKKDAAKTSLRNHHETFVTEGQS